MSLPEYDWYILFPNHHEGLRLNGLLKERGIKNTVSPTPRAASSSCGISLIVDRGDVEIIKQIIAETKITIEKIIPLAKREWKYRSC